MEVFNGSWSAVYLGETIGRCKIISLPEILAASRIRLKIIESGAPAAIAHFGVALNEGRLGRGVTEE